MIFYKNDPKYNTSFMSINAPILTVGNVKIRKDKKNTKSHNLEILINQVQSGVKSVYDRGYRDNLHQFQCHTV